MNTYITTVKQIAKEVVSEAKKTKRKSAFVIMTNVRKSSVDLLFLPKRKTDDLICGCVVVFKLSVALLIAKAIDGKVDYLLIDAEQKVKGMNNLVKIVFTNISKSKILTFKGNDFSADSTDAILMQLLDQPFGKKVGLVGAGNIGNKVALKLVERGFAVSIACPKIKHAQKIAEALNLIKPKYCKSKVIAKSLATVAKNVDVLIGFSPGIPAITSKMVSQMKKNGIILDGGIGTIYSNAIHAAQKNGIQVVRVDIRSGFSGAMKLMFQTKDLLEKTVGHTKFQGINIVAGGLYGKYGDIVIDSITQPRQVIGIADGMGGILREDVPLELSTKLLKVKQWMSKKASTINNKSNPKNK